MLPDHWRVIAKHPGPSIVLKSGLSYYFFELKRHIRKYCAEKNLIVSETFIDEQIIGLLTDSKGSSTNLADIAFRVKNWVEDIGKTMQNEYKVILPLNRYHFRKEIDMPKMKIIKISDDPLEENLCSILTTRRDLIDAKNLAKDNETDIFAIITTRANDMKSAVDLAQGMLDRFVYAVKLIDPNTAVSSRKNSYESTLMSYAVYSESKNTLYTNLARLNEPSDIIQSSDFYDKFDKTWIRLLDFLFAEHPTELQKLIIDALYWYGEVDTNRHSFISQYLYCLIGLEKLLVSNHHHEKAKQFGLHASIMLHGNADHACFYEGYYKKRNSLVHEGPIIIYKEDADSLRIWLRQILLELIDNVPKYIDLESYYNDVHGIKW